MWFFVYRIFFCHPRSTEFVDSLRGTFFKKSPYDPSKTFGSRGKYSINKKVLEKGYEIKEIKNTAETGGYHIVIVNKDGDEWEAAQ